MLSIIKFPHNEIDTQHWYWVLLFKKKIPIWKCLIYYIGFLIKQSFQITTGKSGFGENQIARNRIENIIVF